MVYPTQRPKAKAIFHQTHYKMFHQIHHHPHPIMEQAAVMVEAAVVEVVVIKI
jgi:hypothetical protein